MRARAIALILLIDSRTIECMRKLWRTQFGPLSTQFRRSKIKMFPLHDRTQLCDDARAHTHYTRSCCCVSTISTIIFLVACRPFLVSSLLWPNSTEISPKKRVRKWINGQLAIFVWQWQYYRYTWFRFVMLCSVTYACAHSFVVNAPHAILFVMRVSGRFARRSHEKARRMKWRKRSWNKKLCNNCYRKDHFFESFATVQCCPSVNAIVHTLQSIHTLNKSAHAWKRDNWQTRTTEISKVKEM